MVLVDMLHCYMKTMNCIIFKSICEFMYWKVVSNLQTPEVYTPILLWVGAQVIDVISNPWMFQ